MEKIKQQFVKNITQLESSATFNEWMGGYIDRLPMIQAKFELLALFASLKGKIDSVIKKEILKACDGDVWRFTEQSVYTKIASYLYHNDKESPLRTVINNALNNFSIHPKTPIDFKFTEQQEKDIESVFLKMQPKEDKKRR